MLSRENNFKSIVLIVWMIALSAVTVILGAIPMRTLRVALGRAPYWLLMSGMSILFWGFGWKPLSVTLVCLSLVVGLYREFELKGFGYFYSGLMSVFFGFLGILAGFWGWTNSLLEPWRPYIENKAVEMVNQFESSGIIAVGALKTDDLFLQAPSALIIILSLAVFFSLVFEARLFLWMGIVPPKKGQLLGFKIPEFYIWVFIASLIGSFIDTGSELARGLGVNLFNLSLILFFFQGLAVVFYYFRVFRIGFFWKMLTIFMIFGQPLGMMGVSSLGLVDYWAGFRNKLKKVAPMKKEMR